MTENLIKGIKQIKERDTYSSGGFKQDLGFGVSPVVITIDLQKSMSDPDAPRASNNINEVVANTNEVIKMAREAGIPIIHVRANRLNDPEKTDLKIGRYKERNGGLESRDDDQSEFHNDLDVRENDLILEKGNPSAFHGTQLQPILTSNEIDTAIITGCNASGCVRATTVDAVQDGFKTVIIPECITDRTEEQVAMALVDFDLKYADIMSMDEIIEHMDSAVLAD